MPHDAFRNVDRLLDSLDPGRPVLIAGPTASGKSALALEIARRQGGAIINADASQVYGCWRVLTARPSATEEAQAAHHLYGHVSAQTDYSAGHWLRDVTPLLAGPERAIIIGGTGLYFMALTRGLADIPPTPAVVRAKGDGLSLEAMLAALDTPTAGRIDIANRARVQRAWEVLQATGIGLAAWQDRTGDALLPVPPAQGIVFEVPRDWLNDRIARRFDAMLAGGALEEARALAADHDPTTPAHRAIGAPELMAHLRGEISLAQARDRAIIATRQFAKRQRTWFRSKMQGWWRYAPHGPE